MSTIGIARKRLILKELRQIWPLMASSLIITVLLYLLVLVNPAISVEHRPMAFEALFVLLPGLFAVGIGAMLIGQEKEQRTILWLRSLPLAKQDLVGSKLIAGLISLAFIWIASLVLVTVFAGEEYWLAGNQHAVSTWQDMLTIPLHTVYLVLAGLAISWRVQSTFFGLILLLPIASLPLILATFVSSLFKVFSRLETNSALLIISQVICCFAATIVGWRFAMKHLSAAATKAARIPISSKKLSLGTPYPPTSALLWQFASQSRTVLKAVIAMFLVAIIFAYVAMTDSSYNVLGISSLMAIALPLMATSWLGVLVFQSDRTNRRIRFLADRGLSPGLVWRTRQAIPFCISLSANLVLVFTTAFAVIFLKSPEVVAQMQVVAAFAFPVLLATVTTYAASQWLAQLSQGPIVAAIVAPPLCLGVLAYYVICYTELRTPMLLLVVAALLPLLATRVLMKRWMDDRFDWKYWTAHIATALLCIVLPLVPIAHQWVTAPAISASIRTALVEQAKASTLMMSSNSFGLQLPPSRKELKDRLGTLVPLASPDAGQRSAISTDEVEAAAVDLLGPDGQINATQETSEPSLAELPGLNFPPKAAPSTDTPSIDTPATDTPANAGQASDDSIALEDLTITQRRNYIFERLKNQAADWSGRSAYCDSYTLSWLRSELMVNRLSALNKTDSIPSDSQAIQSDDPKPTGKVSEVIIPAQRYNELLVLVAQIAESVRRGADIFNQEMADRIEILLVSELRQAQGKQLISQNTWDSVCNVIAARDKRNMARRMSVAVSWTNVEKVIDKRSNSLIDAVRLNDTHDLVSAMMLRRRVGYVAELLWQLSYCDQGNSEKVRTELAKVLQVPPKFYGLGDGGNYLRADNLEQFLFETVQSLRIYILGSQWHGRWEFLAEQLAQEAP